jgi:hypothetical protein
VKNLEKGLNGYQTENENPLGISDHFRLELTGVRAKSHFVRSNIVSD